MHRIVCVWNLNLYIFPNFRYLTQLHTWSWLHVSFYWSYWFTYQLHARKWGDFNRQCSCNKLTSVFYMSIVALSKYTCGYSTLLWQCYDIILCQYQERCLKNCCQCYLFFTITNCEIVCSCSLHSCFINYNIVCLSVHWQRNLANECARISAVFI